MLIFKNFWQSRRNTRYLVQTNSTYPGLMYPGSTVMNQHKCPLVKYLHIIWCILFSNMNSLLLTSIRVTGENWNTFICMLCQGDFHSWLCLVNITEVLKHFIDLHKQYALAFWQSLSQHEAIRIVNVKWLVRQSHIECSINRDLLSNA